MNDLTLTNLPEVTWSLEQHWADLDACDTADAYTHWRRGKNIAMMLTKGVTQEVLAERLSKAQPDIAKLRAIGVDIRLENVIRAANSNPPPIPKYKDTLYELTTLDDEGFAELCKPTTTRDNIRIYKNRLKGPTPTPTPTPTSDLSKISQAILEPGRTFEELEREAQEILGPKDPMPTEAPPKGCTWEFSEASWEWEAAKPPQPESEGPHHTVHWNDKLGEWVSRYDYTKKEQPHAATPPKVDPIHYICGRVRQSSNSEMLIKILNVIRQYDHPDKGGDGNSVTLIGQLIADLKTA